MAGLRRSRFDADPPRHEFLPSREGCWSRRHLNGSQRRERSGLSREDARASTRAALQRRKSDARLRVCRLGIVYPEIYAMQVRANLRGRLRPCGARASIASGRDDSGRGTREEMQVTCDAVKAVADAVIARRGPVSSVPTGSAPLVEAAARLRVRAASCRNRAVLQFRTTISPQTSTAYSRDDAEASFIPK